MTKEKMTEGREIVNMHLTYNEECWIGDLCEQGFTEEEGIEIFNTYKNNPMLDVCNSLITYKD